VDDSVLVALANLGSAMVRRVRKGDALAEIERDLLTNVASLKPNALIVAGHHARSRSDGPAVLGPKRNPSYVFVINVMDGEQNYARGSNTYGASLSATSANGEEHFAVVYDGLRDRIIELGYGSTFSVGSRDPLREPSEPQRTSIPGKRVVAIGRVFSAGEGALAELGGASLPERVNDFETPTARIYCCAWGAARPPRAVKPAFWGVSR
jgi:hypothetical protein